MEKKTVKRERKISLEEALKTIRDHGLSISAPSEQLEAELIKESVERLGLIEAAKPKVIPYGKLAPRKEVIPSEVAINLQFPHSVNSINYGPGEVIVPRLIAGQLLHHDRIAKDAENDAYFNKTVKCYMIIERKNSQGDLGNVAVKVRSDFFDAPSSDGDSLIYTEITPQSFVR